MVYTLLDAGDMIFATGAGLIVIAAFLSLDFARATVASERLTVGGTMLLALALLVHLF